MFNWFGDSPEVKKTAQKVYGAIVAQARSKEFYTRFCITDSPTGRFDLLVVHLFLVLERLKSEGEDGKKLSQFLIETFITDMDYSLRELGVGDLSIAKKVRKLNSALFGRLKMYGQSIEAGNSAELADQVARSLYSDLSADDLDSDEFNESDDQQNTTFQRLNSSGGSVPDESGGASSRQLSRNMAEYMRAAHMELGKQPISQISDGQVNFPNPLTFTDDYNTMD